MKKLAFRSSTLMMSIFLFAMIASCNSSKNAQSALESEKGSIQSMLDKCTSEKNTMSTDLKNAQSAAEQAKKQLEDRTAELNKLKSAVDAENQKLQKMKSELTAAFADYDKEAIRIDERDGRLIVVMQNQILYASGKAEVVGQGLEAVQTISQVFKNNQGLNILIESHTDKVPIATVKYKDNWDLSVARSVSVVRLLELYGVNPTRMTAAGRGEFMPAAKFAPDDSNTNAANRRTEFIIAPKMQGLYKMLNEL